MTSPSTIPPKFLSAGNELGVIAVGFSGGQVLHPNSPLPPPPHHTYDLTLLSSLSASPASTPPPPPS